MRAVPSRSSITRAASALAGAAILALALPGCVRPLFPKDEVRSQYETYDLVRNQYEPDYIYDEYGRKTPNLRGRLGPANR